MRIALGLSLLLLGCSTPETPKGSSVTSEAPTVEAPARPAVPRDKWKVKSADEAKVFLQSCEPVKEGSLLLTVEQEATPEFPLWWIGLQIKDGPLLDRCSVDAETQALFCRGDTCP